MVPPPTLVNTVEPLIMDTFISAQTFRPCLCPLAIHTFLPPMRGQQPLKIGILNVLSLSMCTVHYFTGDCGDPPDVENGFISHIFITNITTLTYECTNGYFFQEGVEYNTFRTCLSSNDWSEEIISCSKLNSY